MTGSRELKIPSDSIELDGILSVPDNPNGLVIFAHGSGSSRLSPRNRLVAQILLESGMATLLFDLLTVKEDEVYENRFDIPLLAERLKAATLWAGNESTISGLKMEYFGASTGTAVALVAAADPEIEISAIVSRGGRPDLAKDALSKVTAPTLLIVGGKDRLVIGLNYKAYEVIRTEKQMEIIPDATHLFEEPGALEKVAQLASVWFRKFLVREKAQAGA